jgi:threonine dehydrogenase-like Zn-dependent dehydrogenase
MLLELTRRRPVSHRMKAAVVTRYGAPEVLEIRDVPAPVPDDDEVLIRVRASSVCFGDRNIRRAPLFVRLLNGVRRPKAAILGADLAGRHGGVRPDERRARSIARRGCSR